MMPMNLFLFLLLIASLVSQFNIEAWRSDVSVPIFINGTTLCFNQPKQGVQIKLYSGYEHIFKWPITKTRSLSNGYFSIDTHARASQLRKPLNLYFYSNCGFNPRIYRFQKRSYVKSLTGKCRMHKTKPLLMCLLGNIELSNKRDENRPNGFRPWLF